MIPSFTGWFFIAVSTLVSGSMHLCLLCFIIPLTTLQFLGSAFELKVVPEVLKDWIPGETVSATCEIAGNLSIGDNVVLQWIPPISVQRDIITFNFESFTERYALNCYTGCFFNGNTCHFE